MRQQTTLWFLIHQLSLPPLLSHASHPVSILKPLLSSLYLSNLYFTSFLVLPSMDQVKLVEDSLQKILLGP